VTKTAVKLLAPILQVRSVKAGETIGYNATFKAERDMRVAVIGAGYADGVPVSMTNTGHAVLHDQPTPIVGRVSMDSTILDVTDTHLPVKVGGVVEFLGERLTEMADDAGTINYELLTRIGQRVRRDYWKPKSRDNGAAPKAAPSKKPRSGQKGPRKGGPSGRRHPGGNPGRQRSPGR
jgi:alanine racemase